MVPECELSRERTGNIQRAVEEREFQVWERDVGYKFG